AGVLPDSPAWRDLEALATRAREVDGTINGVTPRSEAQAIADADAALDALRARMLEIETRHPGLVDPDVPLVLPGGLVVGPAVAPAGRRIDLRAHMPETATPLGRQHSIDL